MSVLGVFLVRFFPHLESECGIIRTRKTLNTGTFCTVISFHTPDERSSLIQTGYKFNPCFKMFSDVKLRKNGLDLLPDFKLSFLKTESVFFLNYLKYGLKLSIWHQISQSYNKKSFTVLLSNHLGNKKTSNLTSIIFIANEIEFGYLESWCALTLLLCKKCCAVWNQAAKHAKILHSCTQISATEMQNVDLLRVIVLSNNIYT